MEEDTEQSLGGFFKRGNPCLFLNIIIIVIFLYPSRRGLGMPFASGEKEGRFLSSLWSSKGRLFLSLWSSQVSVVAGVVET